MEDPVIMVSRSRENLAEKETSDDDDDIDFHGKFEGQRIIEHIRLWMYLYHLIRWLRA